jgi:predicted Zn-dependent protease
MVYRLRGEVPKLLAMLDRLLAMAPDHPELSEWAAWSYMASGQPERARTMLVRQTARHPDDYRSQSWLWQCLDMMERSEEADRQRQATLECLMEAVRRHPDDTYARSLLAAQLVLSGEMAAGVAQAERTLEISPHDGRLRYNAACTFARAGMAERAIAELKEGVRQVPSYISDWPRRDPDLASLHDHPEFIAMFGKAEKS